GPRLAIDGHVDVVPPGSVPWAPGGPRVGAGGGGGGPRRGRHGTTGWGGAAFVQGRGSIDVKGSVLAPLHALAALGGRAPHGEVVLVAVASEEDGGLGTFAALERDSALAAWPLPGPTGCDVVCAQAGALTFEGTVHGVAAHAAHRLEGVSAIDRHLPVHAALAARERARDAG